MPAPQLAPTPAAQTQPDRGIIVEAGNGARLRVFHLDTGAETDVNVPVAQYPDRPLVTGGAVVFLSGGNAYALASPFDGTPKLLGAAEHVFASVNPGRPWIIVNTPEGFAAQMVDVTGGAVTVRIPLPDGLTPLADMVGGLVMQDRDGTLRLFDTEAGRVLCTIGDAGLAAGDRVVLATHDTLVAWRACNNGQQCSLHLTDVSAGTDRVIAAPDGSTSFLAGGALSPDGTTLAAFVDQSDAARRTSSVVLTDTTTGALTPVANSAIEYGEDIGVAAWSPTSQWLYFCGGNGGPIKGYRLTNPAAIDLTIPGSYTFATD